MKAKSKKVTDYWLEFYIDEDFRLCSLCGNYGFVDTSGTVSPAGVECGRVNYCICPNGQVMRKLDVALPKGVYQ